jgi:tetratricopeptide (TPR) repeat protein
VASDWYRNETWSPEIEKTFQEKLKKCRTQGPQYLFIQAYTLAENEPRTALKLLEQYNSTGDTFRTGQALEVQAMCYVALGLIEEAINGYKHALAWEALHPHTVTRSGLELSFLVATHRKRDEYQLIVNLLQDKKLRLVFPVDMFMYATSLALIHSDAGNEELCRQYAQKALAAASAEKSQFSRHPTVGLVGRRFAPEIKQMSEIVKGQRGLLSRVKSFVKY